MGYCDCGGAIYGNGDECGRCLLNNAIARDDINWLRFTDALDMARRWENRAALKSPSYCGSYMAIDSEIGIWCERAATLAMILGKRIGEDEHQRTVEIPEAAVRIAYLTSRTNHSVRHHLAWIMRPEAIERRQESESENG